MLTSQILMPEYAGGSGPEQTTRWFSGCKNKEGAAGTNNSEAHKATCILIAAWWALLELINPFFFFNIQHNPEKQRKSSVWTRTPS